MKGLLAYMKKKILIVIILLISSVTVLLIRRGNLLFVSKNDVVGVDISHYQGDVDFEKMEKDNIKFAFVKATEGTKYKDDMYKKNMERAKKATSILAVIIFFRQKVVEKNKQLII